MIVACHEWIASPTTNFFAPIPTEISKEEYQRVQGPKVCIKATDSVLDEIYEIIFQIAHIDRDWECA